MQFFWEISNLYYNGENLLQLSQWLIVFCWSRLSIQWSHFHVFFTITLNNVNKLRLAIDIKILTLYTSISKLGWSNDVVLLTFGNISNILSRILRKKWSHLLHQTFARPQPFTALPTAKFHQYFPILKFTKTQNYTSKFIRLTVAF